MTRINFSSIKTDKPSHPYTSLKHKQNKLATNKNKINANKTPTKMNKDAKNKSSIAQDNQNFGSSIIKKLIKWSIVSCIGTVAIYFWGHEDFHSVIEIPKHTDAFYVNDYSHSLLDSTERFIEAHGRKLYNQTSAQVVVTMVPNTGNKTLESFSLEMANQWEIGTKDKDNGILLLFTTDEAPPHVRLEIGKGLEGDIPDAKAGRILDVYAVPYKKDKKFDEAALKTYVAILSLLYQKYQLPVPVTLSKEAIDTQLNTINKELEQQVLNNETEKNKYSKPNE